jgi:hypothetical protein
MVFSFGPLLGSIIYNSQQAKQKLLDHHGFYTNTFGSSLNA